MGVTDFDDDALLNDMNQLDQQKNLLNQIIKTQIRLILSIMNKILVYELPTQSSISHAVQLTTSSASTTSSKFNAIGYKRVRVTESEARKISGNLATRK